MRLFYLNLYNCSTSLPLYFANPGKSLISILVLAVLSWALIYLAELSFPAPQTCSKIIVSITCYDSASFA